MEGQDPVAIGRLGQDGPWVGFRAGPAGHHLVFGLADGRLRQSPARGARRTSELLAAMIAYYEEALEPPPPDLEATQRDLARLLGALADSQANRERRVTLREALDAIDDGLAGDAVVARLIEARRSLSGVEPNEQTDLVGLLAARFRELVGAG